MKRIVIDSLLQAGTAAELSTLADQLLPIGVAGAKTAAAARLILIEAVRKSRKVKLNAAGFFAAAITSPPSAFSEFLQGTSAADIEKATMSRARALLADLLTSKAGRKKTSELSRSEQLAAAQVRRREKVKLEGKKQLNVWITPEASNYLNAIQQQHGCATQADALELVLNSAVHGAVLSTEA